MNETAYLNQTRTLTSYISIINTHMWHYPACTIQYTRWLQINMRLQIGIPILHVTVAWDYHRSQARSADDYWMSGRWSAAAPLPSYLDTTSVVGAGDAPAHSPPQSYSNSAIHHASAPQRRKQQIDNYCDLHLSDTLTFKQMTDFEV